MKVERRGGASTPIEEAIRARLEAEGYRVEAWTEEPGVIYDLHSHDEDGTHSVVRGAMAINIAGKEYVLRPGDRGWLPKGTVHTVRFLGPDPVRYLIGKMKPN